MMGRSFATNAARISAVKPSYPAACLRIAPVGAKEGVDVLPLFSRGIIVKVFANVFFKIGKPQRDVLAAARASPAFQRYVLQRKRAPQVLQLRSLKQITIARQHHIVPHSLACQSL
jgi:hypothetical protein